MKLMFIDDERNVVLGLQRIVDWRQYGFKVIDVAANGQEGLTKIQALHPDIVLLDIRMPGLSGIELIRTAREQGFAGEFILLTAHADFDYAHDAIRYGVVDYLLKPVDEDELLRAVLEAEKRIMATSVLDLYGSQSLSTMRSALFERALAGNLDNIALRLSLNEGDPCRLMVIDCKNESVLPIQQFLDSFPGCSPLHCLTGQRIVLLMQGRAMIAAQDELVQGVRNIDFKAFFFCGKVFFAPEQLPSAFQPIACLMDRFWFVCRKGKSLYSVDEVENRSHLSTNCWNAQQFAAALCQAMDGQDESRIQQMLGALRSAICCRQPSVPDAKAMLLAVSHSISQYVGLHLPNHSSKVEKFPEEIMLAECLDSALLLLRDLSRQVIDWMQLYTNIDICQLLLQHLELNYAQPLQLQNLAREFGYDSAYLGKLLKQKTGFSFNAYLDHVRLQHACVHLRQGKPIALIAQLCGYSSVEYFSQKFRKTFGCSPTQYRRQVTARNAQQPQPPSSTLHI